MLPAPPTGTPRRPPPVPRPAPVERAESRRIADLAARPETEEAFWDAVREEGAPLVEAAPDGEGGHVVVTFVWRGTSDTRAVLALPNKVLDPADWNRNLMRQVPGTSVWHWSVRMRADWRASYVLCVDEGQAPAGLEGRAYGQWLRGQGRRDPYNSGAQPRRWGGEPMSVVDLAASLQDTAPADRVAERAPGTVAVHQVRSAVLGNERRVWVYAPAGHHPAPLPVAVVFDGEMWEPELRLSQALDALPPMVVLMPESLGGDTRWAELACSEAFADFLSTELLPWAADRWPLTTDPARTVLAGQSLGGLTAAYAALREPERFGVALSQSGSFWWPSGTPDERGAEWLTDRIGELPPLPVRFVLSAGLQEWVLLPASRRLRDVLRAKGYDVDYREFNGGHDYLCWRDELVAALGTVAGGS
ncbi:enterochelin esterase [Streptomyces sp. H39-S7]|uniref:enterochelin esterase n=1 Tax=Streptomyces sp. H39-S7 TaxID=3004357 RepID=UPI0022AE6C54|nr:enterochelin esterase [Streptomyces sp. H39-S7]MCZ4123091.1 enterochelin esterase [Streptomyces sp. H39-S7]